MTIYIYILCDNMKTCIISYYALCLFSCVSNHTLYGNIFGHLGDASSAWHRCRKEICMNATQANTEEGERVNRTFGYNVTVVL